jgi:CRP-like cAMP-binding protein
MPGDEEALTRRIEALRGVPLFQDLTDEELDLLARRCSERRLGPGETVFEEGDPGDGLYVIASGAVTLVSGRVGQLLQRLARLGSGAYFGEMGLLGVGVRSASAVTSEPTILVQVRTQELLQVFSERPLLAVKLRTAVIRRHGENVASTLQSSGRRELRIRVDTDVELTLADGSEITCRLEDLSAGGACLRRPPAAWQVGRGVAFILRLPGGEGLLSVTGRVAWRGPTAAGIAFSSVGDGDGAGARGAVAAATVRRAARLLLERSDSA